jgi:cytochrome c oxidase assembly factor CtaG
MIAASLTIGALLYACGVVRAWAAAGVGRSLRAPQVASFAAGWAVLAVALLSRLHEWSETLFTAHMVQHELLMVVAAPLIACGAPLLAITWAAPARWRRAEPNLPWKRARRTVLGWLIAPGAVLCLHALALWLWHVPSFYTAALASDRVHALQHLSFFMTSVLFWWTVVQGQYGHGSYGAAAVYVFGTALQSGVLGALLTFSRWIWYPVYTQQAAAWGLTPLEDQQLAGLAMWVPAGVIFTGAGLACLAAWLRVSARRVDAPVAR